MNIQKNELLLLNKIRFGAGESTASEPVPTPTKQTPEAGMKALTFLGMRNLMSNPNLAQQVGATENNNTNYAPSFKRLASKNSIAALSLAAVMALASCQKQEMSADIDMSMLNGIQEKLQKLIDQNDANKDFYQRLLAYVQVIARNSENDAEFKQKVCDYIANDSAVQAQLLKQSQATGKDVAQIKADLAQLLSDYQLGAITFEDLLLGMKDILGNIDSTLSLFFQKYVEAEARKAKHEKNVEERLATMEKYERVISEDIEIIKDNQDSIIVINNEQNSRINTLIREAKISNAISDDMRRILLRNGVTEYQIAYWVSQGAQGVAAANEKLQEIADNTAATNERMAQANIQLDKIYAELRRGNITEAQALAQIKKVLDSIDGKLGKIFDRLGVVIQKQDQYGREARAFYYQNHRDAKELIKATYKNYGENKKQTARLDSLIVLENEKAALADSLIKAYKEGNAEIIAEMKNNTTTIVNAFNVPETHQDFEKLMVFLQNWRKEDHQDNINIYGGEKTIIALIEKYGPLINSNEGIIDAITLFMDQEKAADKAAANQQEIDVNALIDAINDATTAINAIGTKADVIISKMDTQISTYAKWGQNAVNAINENTEILKTLSFETPDLKVLEAYLKELVKQGNTANNWLEAVYNKQGTIGDQITNLEQLAGKQFTIEELDAVWSKHDADAYNKAKAYFNSINVDLKDFLQGLHDQNMEKANAGLTYLQQGNQIALDTYNLVASWAAKADTNAANYKQILNKIYDYLPNLICNCKCKEDVNSNEGIQEQINNLLNH